MHLVRRRKSPTENARIHHSNLITEFVYDFMHEKNLQANKLTFSCSW
uniref:Uncharacterized protein n=1 Tax=Anguilla anguilla TaxID=7936 RepID=A0A0E9PQC9_ANGAN